MTPRALPRLVTDALPNGWTVGARLVPYCEVCLRRNLDTDACPNAGDLCLDCCGEEH